MPATQTRLESLKESLSNTGLAFGLSWASHCWLIAPLLLYYEHSGGNAKGWLAGLLVTIYYTILSLFRNYAIRRWHNSKTDLAQANKDRFPIIPPPPDDIP